MSPAHITSIIQQARTRNRQLLTEVEAKAALTAAGIPVSETRLARSRDEALIHAQALGFPVVLKICSPDIVHKSDVGGVALNLRTPDAVTQAFDTMISPYAAPPSAGERVCKVAKAERSALT